MSLHNSKTGYGLFTIVIHWLSALVVFGLFILGWWMVDLDYYSSWYQTAPMWHVGVGVLLTVITIVRLIWRMTQPMPTKIGSKWEQTLASITHLVFYVLIFTLFCAGYLLSTADGRGLEVFNWFVIPSLGELFTKQESISGDVHEIAAYVLIILAIVHALAALKHHFLNRDNTLSRMLKPANQTNGEDK